MGLGAPPFGQGGDHYSDAWVGDIPFPILRGDGSGTNPPSPRRRDQWETCTAFQFRHYGHPDPGETAGAA